MRIVGREIIDKAKRIYPECRNSLESWIAETMGSIWQTSQDIKLFYSSASFLHRNYVIFNIKGNQYRLVIKVAYKTKIVLIKWFGTHADYEKIDWEKVIKGEENE